MPSQGERAVHRNVTLTTTQVEILPVNPLRKYALLVNDSDSTAYIALGIPAAVNEGIRLNANGGSYEINLTNLFNGRIYAVSSVATKLLMVTELSYAA